LEDQRQMGRQNPGGRSIHARNSKLEKGGGGQGWLEEENRGGPIWAVAPLDCWMDGTKSGNKVELLNCIYYLAVMKC